MRRCTRDEIEAHARTRALKVCCAACHAKAGEECVDDAGRPRKPHRVRMVIGSWAGDRQ